VRVDSDNGAGTVLNLESLFGLERRSIVGRLDGVWQINERHALQFGALSLKRQSTRALSQNITVGDQFFAAGTVLDVDSTSNLIMASWMPRFSASEFYSFSGLAGIHFMDQQFSFASGALAVDVRRKLGVPLPMLGFDYTTHPSPDWRVSTRMQLFALSYEDVRSSARDVRVAVSWEPWQHGGFGLAYNMFRVRAAADNEDYRGSFLMDRGGFELYAIAKF
jgi:hypothetical protein